MHFAQESRLPHTSEFGSALVYSRPKKRAPMTLKDVLFYGLGMIILLLVMIEFQLSRIASRLRNRFPTDSEQELDMLKAINKIERAKSEPR
jgi:hypothetical protein